MSELLVIQHHPATGPSAFREVLDLRTSIVPWRLVDLSEGDQLPEDLDGIAAVLTMGGTMSTTRPEELPWMGPELDLLRRAVEAERPVLGVCLGAQLIAVALGGEVAALQVPRAAFTALRRTAAGAGQDVTAGWPDGAPALLMHEDEVVRYPEGARPLLTGPQDEVAAWGSGSAVAVQAHPEVTAEQLEGWLRIRQLEELLARAGVDPTTLLTEATTRERFSVPLGQALVGRWLDGPVRQQVG